MPLAEARALFDGAGVRIEAHAPKRDQAALRSLAVWAHRFSPTVAGDEPDGLLLDVSGCGVVFGGEESLIEQACAGLRRLGFRARAAIAPTYGGAWAVARYGGEVGRLAPHEELTAVLGPLPVASLRLSADAVAGLGEVGVERVGHLIELPRSSLPRRFGGEVLLQLDRALGRAIETIDPVRPTPPIAVERLFGGPTTRTDAIERTVRELLAEMSDRLGERESGARSVEVTLLRSDLAPERLTLTFGRPCRDAKRLWTLLRPQLETAHLGFGVEGVRVHVRQAARLRHEQTRHEQAQRSESDVSASEAERAMTELLDTLSNRLGADRVLRARARASHLPERAFERRPAFETDTEAGTKAAGITARDRPTVLFDRPVPTEVVALTPDGPVHRVRWGGRERSVIACRGPERIEPEWWRRHGSARDYFAVQAEDGLWLWLARAHASGRWYVHGVWA